MTGGHWFSTWNEILGLQGRVSEWLLATLLLLGAYALVILPSAVLMTYLERKIGADLQARIGPSKAGPAGVLQPLADFLKLLQKDLQPDRSRGETLWGLVHVMALFSTVAVLPLGSASLLVDTDMSAFLPFWAVLVLALGTMLLGLNQASVPGWFGGVRVAAQALSGGFPALISLLCAGTRASAFRWSVIVESQGAVPFFGRSWAAFSNPFQFVAFVVFVVSGLIILGIPPMEAGLSIPDIHGGVSARMGGRRQALFSFGRFYGFFLWSAISAALFLGGWNLPGPLQNALKDLDAGVLTQALELLVLLAKTFSIMLLVIWVAKANPRDRSDQITDLAWKVLSPLSLMALAGAAVLVAWRGLT